MRSLARLIERVNGGIGQAASWLALCMVLLQLLVVIGRYVFGIGSIRVQETILYMHAFLFLLAAGYTLQTDGHVRVDIFYRGASPRRKALVNLLGALFFAVPLAGLVIFASWSYVGRSWAIMERSREVSGLPAVFILKTGIILFAVEIGLAGAAMAIRSALALGGDPDELRALSGSELPETV
jgi:TRAP-type mannitol/chloroaromatic compound transport system permease small subunit